MRMILTMNNFVFNGEHFVQEHGTVMGTTMAPAFANLFMGNLEEKALGGFQYKPLFWFCYTDDISMVWTHGNEKVDTFIAYLNSIHSTIKFTSERSTTSIPFLDVNIQLHNGKIETDLYCKATDKHQYLLYSSSHPFHAKKSIPYSLALRLRRISSKEDSFNIRATELELYLTKRGYKNRFIKSQIARAKLIPRNDALNEHNRDTPKPTRVPFIITYNPALPNIREILHKKQLILDSTERLHKIFSETPVVAFRRSPNLRDLLVCAKLKSPESNTLCHILLVLSVAIRDTAVSLALTSMTVEPPTCSAPQVRHGRSNNTSLTNQTILLI